MQKKMTFFRRSFAVAMASALVVNLFPMGALMADAADAVEKPIGLFQQNNGRASEYGLQDTKFVDANGKTVDEVSFVNKDYVDNGDALKYIANSTDSDVSEPEAGFNGTASGLKAKYTSPYLTKPATNQGSWGCCWAFGSTAAMEANVVKKISANKITGLPVTKDNIDFSERYLAWFSHNTKTTDKTDIAYGDGIAKNTPAKAYTGGNQFQVAYALAMGTGPELEGTAKYDTTSAMKGVAENLRNYSVARLTDTNTLSNYQYSDANVNTVKAMIYNYGAATLTYGSADSGYKADSNGETSFYTGKRGANHMISIIGWDDNYSASNFKKTPQGNGAWLCRNSWSANWGSGTNKTGNFWISYYEPLNDVCVFDMDAADTYSKAYYYVRDSGTALINYGEDSGKSATAANIYRASGDESLTSVGVQTNQNGLKAEVTIYTSDTPMAGPQSGAQQATATTTVADLGLRGYHRINLSKAVTLKKDQYFSVIIKLSGSTSTYFSCESNGAGIEKKGQTFYRSSSGRWVDATDKTMKSFKNAAIYAYTKTSSVTVDDTNTLNSLKTFANSLKQADVENMSGADAWARIQLEKTIAGNVKQARNITRSIKMMESALSIISSKNMYADATLSNGPGKNGVEIFANGGTVKVNGVSTNYKSRTLSFSFPRTHSWVRNKNGFVGKVSGKYVVGLTKTATPPTLNANGTVQSDADAMAIAGAKISGSKVIINPKAEGDVYVWVLWYPKSGLDQEERIQTQMKTGYAMTKVHVDTAPANVRLYASDNANPVNNDIGYTAQNIPAGGSTYVYVKGTVGKITKTVNTMQVIQNSYIGYNCTVPAKYADYVNVTKDASNPQKFHIAVDAGINNIIKDGKKLTVTLPFVCDKNGRKANFKVIIGNPVKTMSIAAGDDTTNLSVNNTTKTVSVVMDSAKAAAKTAMLKETTTFYNAGRKGTDGTSIIRIPCENGFTYSAAGGISVVGKVGAAQKKVSIAAVKKQPGYYKITAAKGTQGGTEAYFVIAHNAYGRMAGAGYQVVHVKVGEANHITKMVVERSAADTASTLTTDKTSGIVQLQMDDSLTVKKTAQVTETLTLADATKEGTDITGIYRLPSADSFTVTTAKEITVTEALSAEQKKVTMAKKAKTTNEYVITAAKGTRQGTEAYFMLFHNSEQQKSGTGYTIIKVTVGVANHVKTMSIKSVDGSNVSTDNNKIATVTMENSVKASKKVKISEAITLQTPSNVGTDPMKMLRMPTADGFKVTAAKEVVVSGTLTAAQKKVTMAKVKGTDDTYQITAAKGVKAGTEVYFMLFHNAVLGGSGTGYQIIKVVFE